MQQINHIYNISHTLAQALPRKRPPTPPQIVGLVIVIEIPLLKRGYTAIYILLIISLNRNNNFNNYNRQTKINKVDTQGMRRTSHSALNVQSEYIVIYRNNVVNGNAMLQLRLIYLANIEMASFNPFPVKAQVGCT